MSALEVAPAYGAVVRRRLIAAGFVVLLVVGSHFASMRQPGHRPFGPGAAGLLLATVGALAWRRRRPVLVLGIVFATTLVWFLLDYSGGPIWLCVIVAYCTAIVEGHRVAAALAAAAGFVVFPWMGPLLGRGPAPSVVSLLALGAWQLVLFGGAEAVRIRRQRAAEEARIRETEARQRADEERLRIARDLHDVLAHNISLINVQAGVALHLNQELPEQARTALTAIKQASKEALGELRSVLDVLRRTGDAAPRSPTPGLAQLGELVEGAAGAGLDIRLNVENEPRPLPAAVDLAAYRIVQEALTNVMRHARATTVWVHVVHGDRDLTLRIEDDGRATPGASRTPPGKGIAGMQERAAALGGRVVAEPRPGGGFRVAAHLPLEGTP
jgi:signal transduction histidine kinase